MKKLVILFFVMMVSGCASFPLKPSIPTDAYVTVKTYLLGVQPISQGSGAVIHRDDEGSYVLTAAHVCVHDARTEMLGITPLTQDTRAAYVIRVDLERDMCILHVPGWQAENDIDLGAKPDIGDQVFSVSAPHGTVSETSVPVISGIFSGSWNGMNMYSMTIAPGSSGGMIVNRRGQLVGMTIAVPIVGADPLPYEHIGLSPEYGALSNFVESYE